MLLLLLSPTLLRLLLVVLRFSPLLALPVFGRTFGATITSASGAILAKGDVVGGAGVSEVTTIFAVEVGERCKVSGCKWFVGFDPGLV